MNVSVNAFAEADGNCTTNNGTLINITSELKNGTLVNITTNGTDLSNQTSCPGPIDLGKLSLYGNDDRNLSLKPNL